MMASGEGGIVVPERSTTDELLAEAVVLAEATRRLLLAGDGHGTAAAGSIAASLGRLHRAARLGVLTALLGHGVAWLLARKAVAAGELSPAEGAAPARRLGTMPPLDLPDTEARQAAADDGAGRVLAELEGRVRLFHGRLARLDRLLDAPCGGPADSLQQAAEKGSAAVQGFPGRLKE